MKLRPLGPDLKLPYAQPGLGGSLGVLVDYFAGGGGASTGLERAYGRKVDLAVNHDPEAIAMHMANHPDTDHAISDVFEFDIIAWLQDRLWDVWWTSPDCTHHSRAKGGKPVSNKRRALADVVVEVVERLPPHQRPRVIHLENVPEFVEWGPLDAGDRPDKTRKGEFFAAWRARLEAAGYKVEHRTLVAADYGSPTTRKRLCLIARCDGLPIVWPERTHINPKRKRAKGEVKIPRGLKPWRTAAECIDFSIPGRSIFGRDKELADATLRRVARGTFKFVLDNPTPFIVPLTHQGERRLPAMDEPFPTVTCANRGEMALVSAHVTKFRANSTGHEMGEPLHTITANSFELRGGGAAPLGMVEAVMSPHIVSVAHGDSGGRREYPVEEPLGTITTGGQQHAVAAVHLTGITQKSTPRIFAADAPMPTITTAKGGELLVTAASLVQTGYGEREGQEPRALDIEKPAGTIIAQGNKFALQTAHLLRLQGSDRRDGEVDEPLGAVLAQGGHHAHVAAFLAQFNNTRGVEPQAGKPLDAPVSTISTVGPHQALIEAMLTPDEIEAGCERVLAFMLKYYGTATGAECDEPMDSVTTKDRFALITVHINGVPYRIFDIRIRMLTARELFNAQGFPRSYIIDPMVPLSAAQLVREQKRGTGVTHKRMSKGSSIAKCGNSVPPDLACALARANAPPFSRLEGAGRWEGKRA